MTVLNDAEIRPQLITWLNGKVIKPQLILNEVTISDGSARPDIIAIYRYTHCYEIKGDNDQIERISKQLGYYQASFKKNTLITTRKHLKKALELLPNFWGLVVAIPTDNNSITFKYIRKSSYNPLYRKDIASKILWKEEMQNLLKKKSISFTSKSTRFDLIELIQNSATSNELDKFVCNTLLNRKIS